MRGNGLCFTGPLQHEQLRQNGDALEPNAEGPGDFEEGVLHGEEDGQDKGEAEKEFYAEGVEVGVVCWLVGARHQVDDVALRGDEEDFEDEVVGGSGPGEVWGVLAGPKRGGEVKEGHTKISCDVDKQIQHLRFERNA